MARAERGADLVSERDGQERLLEGGTPTRPRGHQEPALKYPAALHEQLHVVDRGPGIPAGDRDRIFVPFQRLGDTDNTSGVGLGLALSRGLTEVMGGTLDPDETPGGGMTMILSLPAAPTAPPTVAAPGLRERDG